MSKYQSEGILKGIEFTLGLEQNVKPYYYNGIEKLLLGTTSKKKKSKKRDFGPKGR